MSIELYTLRFPCLQQLQNWALTKIPYSQIHFLQSFAYAGLENDLLYNHIQEKKAD